MSRLKARYVATVTIEINEEYVPGRMLPVEQVKENVVKHLTPDLQEIIASEVDCRDLIRQLAGEGKSLKEIMELTGKSEPTVRKYMKEAESDS